MSIHHEVTKDNLMTLHLSPHQNRTVQSGLTKQSPYIVRMFAVGKDEGVDSTAEVSFVTPEDG